MLTSPCAFISSSAVDAIYIKKLVQAMPEVKAGLVIDRRDNYGKLADMILGEVLKENGKRGLVDAGWRPTWNMKKMGF